MSPVRPGRLRTRLFRATLLGYPREFRRSYARDLEQTFEDAWMEESVTLASSSRLWFRLVRDGLVNGVRMRFEGGVPMNSPFGGMMQDLRVALRGVRAQRQSAFAVVLTLALGIGAATSIFTVVDALLLRPLPFDRPHELVEVARSMRNGMRVKDFPVVTTRAIADGREVFADLAVTARIDGVLTGEAEPRQLSVRAATPELFSTLGRAPAIGRVYTPAEAVAEARVMVISHELWSSFGRRPGIIGSLLEFDGDRYEVIGVMPPDFRFPTVYAADAFLPLSPAFRSAAAEHSVFAMVARMRPGVDSATVSARLDALTVAAQAGRTGGGEWQTLVEPLGAWRANPDAKRALMLVAGAVGLMLLVALMNATNLLLTRVSARSRDFGVRHAIGASTTRLLRQVIVESMVLALLAGTAAVALALVGVRVLMRFAPPMMTELAANRVAVDDRVLLFAFATTVITGFVLGVLPALAAVASARRRIGASMSIYSAVTRERHRARSLLVVGQVAMAMVLLVGASLLAASFMKVMRVDAGMDIDHTLLVVIEPNARKYPDAEAQLAFARSLEQRIAALPGVDAVTRAAGLPPSANIRFGMAIQVEDDAQPKPDMPDLLPFADVRADFLPTLGTRLVQGRNFEPGETADANVAIIDSDFASYLWGAEPAVGRRFRLDAESPWLMVVGVIDELMLGGPDNALGEYALLRPAPTDLANAAFAIRTRGDAAALVQPVRQAIRAEDRDQPVWQLWTARDAVADEMATQRFFMLLMITLGVLSLTLAALGLYGLLSFTVARRTREMGVRLALGAQRGDVVQLVIRQGLVLALVGTAIGVAGALTGARVIESLLFDTAPGSPMVLAAVAALMLVVAAAASGVPALRAARLNLNAVLRSDS